MTNNKLRTLLVLDLLLDSLNVVGRLDIEGDRLARKGLNKNLHRHPCCEQEYWNEVCFMVDRNITFYQTEMANNYCTYLIILTRSFSLVPTEKPNPM